MPDVVTTPPASEPVTLPEAKAQCRIDGNDEDRLVDALIATARRHVEIQSRRSLVTQHRRATFDRFPATGPLRLIYGPVQSITAVGYHDAIGGAQVLADYQANLSAPIVEVWPAVDALWPDYRLQVGGVSVEYVAGYGAPNAVPEALRQAMLLLIAHWYGSREAVAAGVLVEVPMGVEALIHDFKMPVMV